MVSGYGDYDEYYYQHTIASKRLFPTRCLITTGRSVPPLPREARPRRAKRKALRPVRQNALPVPGTTGAANAPQKTRQHKAALCVAGVLRMWEHPDVHGGYAQALKGIGLRGIMSAEQPDVFVYASDIDPVFPADVLPVQDSHGRSLKRAEWNASRKDAVLLFQKLGAENAVYVKLASAAAYVNERNAHQFVGNARECFKAFKSQERLLRSVNQFHKVSKCLSMVEEVEAEQKQRYDIIILTRPDFALHPGVRLSGKAIVEILRGKIYNQRDYLFVVPRSMLPKLKHAMHVFRHCNPGDACCGHCIRSSEQMYQHVLETPLWMKQLYRITRWVNRGRLRGRRNVRLSFFVYEPSSPF